MEVSPRKANPSRFRTRFRTACHSIDACPTSSYNSGMKTLSIECPDSLVDRLAQLVREGWVADEQQAVIEALRRFLDSHRPELIESQVLADLEWGLHGND
jgi:hypothetical protein